MPIKRNLYLYLVIAGGLLARLLAMYAIPEGYAAPDEMPYFASGLRLFYLHEQNIFRPPFMGWVVFILAHLGITSLGVVRYCWLLFDLLNILLIWTLARGLEPDQAKPILAPLAAGFYALYLPAIGYSVFLLSETPAVCFILAIAWVASRDCRPVARGVAAGALLCLAVFARTNLLPLIITFPTFFIISRDRQYQTRRDVAALCLALALTAAAGIGGYAARNYLVAGRLTLSDNSAYNLYIGNQDVYQEDLDLFHPRATEEQIEFRKEYLARGAAKSDLSYEEMQARGMRYIKDHPLRFARRALGRLARLLAPKTSVLEIIGGERKAGIFNARSLVLLLLANLQYSFVLFLGSAGLVLLSKKQPRYFQLALGIVAGALPLCLVAISKPRFSFPVEPVLLVAAVFLVSSLRENARELWADRRRRGIYLGLVVFYLWAWTAWLIFSFSSRLGIYQ